MLFVYIVSWKQHSEACTLDDPPVLLSWATQPFVPPLPLHSPPPHPSKSNLQALYANQQSQNSPRSKLHTEEYDVSAWIEMLDAFLVW